MLSPFQRSSGPDDSSRALAFRKKTMVNEPAARGLNSERVQLTPAGIAYSSSSVSSSNDSYASRKEIDNPINQKSDLRPSVVK